MRKVTKNDKQVKKSYKLVKRSHKNWQTNVTKTQTCEKDDKKSQTQARRNRGEGVGDFC